MTINYRLIAAGCLLGLMMLIGCGGGEAPPPEAAIDATPYLLETAPEEALEVAAVHQSVAGTSEVVVVGKIGGSLNPWIEGRSAFNIVDRKVKSCTDIPGDGCPTPWDYCCSQSDLAKSTALVKVVGADGKLLAADARRLLGVKELQTVVVRGTATKDDNGNLVVVSTGLFITK
jgi:hypothetical protein